MRTGAVIVAAGLSSRMGSFKPLLPLGQTTLIGQAVTTFKSVCVSPIVVVTGREAEALSRYLEPLGVECVHNPDYAETDMFCSTCIGMKHIANRIDRFFFLPGDSPLFSPDTLRVMAAHMTQTGCDIVRPTHNGKSGHPLLINGDKIPGLLAFDGDGGMRRAIEAANCHVERLAVDDPGITIDADTPDDYAQLVAQLTVTNILEDKKP